MGPTLIAIGIALLMYVVALLVIDSRRDPVYWIIVIQIAIWAALRALATHSRAAVRNWWQSLPGEIERARMEVRGW